MKLEVFNNEAHKIWKHLSESKEQATELLQLELDLYKKLLVFFQIGESCYFIFNFQTLQFDFVSEEVESVLGYTKEETTTDLFMQNIHPDDRAWFLGAQDTCVQFLLELPPEKQMQYKYRIDYRVRKKNGEYIRLMHQVVVVHNDSSGKVFRNLIVLTDISHLKKEGRPVLSYVGMNGEPSYLDVAVMQSHLREDGLLTRREREVLYYMAEGMPSKTICDFLSVSKYTVDFHRKNILRKTGLKNTAEVIRVAIREGWL